MTTTAITTATVTTTAVEAATTTTTPTIEQQQQQQQQQQTPKSRFKITTVGFSASHLLPDLAHIPVPGIQQTQQQTQQQHEHHFVFDSFITPTPSLLVDLNVTDDSHFAEAILASLSEDANSAFRPGIFRCTQCRCKLTLLPTAQTADNDGQLGPSAEPYSGSCSSSNPAHHLHWSQSIVDGIGNRHNSEKCIYISPSEVTSDSSTTATTATTSATCTTSTNGGAGGVPFPATGQLNCCLCDLSLMYRLTPPTVSLDAIERFIVDRRESEDGVGAEKALLVLSCLLMKQKDNPRPIKLTSQVLISNVGTSNAKWDLLKEVGFIIDKEKDIMKLPDLSNSQIDEDLQIISSQQQQQQQSTIELSDETQSRLFDASRELALAAYCLNMQVADKINSSMANSKLFSGVDKFSGATHLLFELLRIKYNPSIPAGSKEGDFSYLDRKSSLDYSVLRVPVDINKVLLIRAVDLLFKELELLEVDHIHMFEVFSALNNISILRNDNYILLSVQKYRNMGFDTTNQLFDSYKLLGFGANNVDIDDDTITATVFGMCKEQGHILFSDSEPTRLVSRETPELYNWRLRLTRAVLLIAKRKKSPILHALAEKLSEIVHIDGNLTKFTQNVLYPSPTALVKPGGHVGIGVKTAGSPLNSSQVQNAMQPLRPTQALPPVAMEPFPVGLYNIGNSCYLNSLLQYYFTVTPLRSVLVEAATQSASPPTIALDASVSPAPSAVVVAPSASPAPVWNHDAITGHSVGGRRLRADDIREALDFVKLLGGLFVQMSSTVKTGRPVQAAGNSWYANALRPSTDLANLALSQIGEYEPPTSQPQPQPQLQQEQHQSSSVDVADKVNSESDKKKQEQQQQQQQQQPGITTTPPADTKATPPTSPQSMMIISPVETPSDTPGSLSSDQDKSMQMVSPPQSPQPSKSSDHTIAGNTTMSNGSSLADDDPYVEVVPGKRSSSMSISPRQSPVSNKSPKLEHPGDSTNGRNSAELDSKENKTNGQDAPDNQQSQLAQQKSDQPEQQQQQQQQQREHGGSRPKRMRLGRQEDVTECMDNIMGLVEAAMKPLGRQQLQKQQQHQQQQQQQQLQALHHGMSTHDFLKHLFYGSTIQRLSFTLESSNAPTTTTKSEEFATLIVNPRDAAFDPREPALSRNLYDALEDTMAAEDVSLEGTTQGARRELFIQRLPAFLQIHIQRAQYDKVTQQQFKCTDELKFPEVLYMDRFMDHSDASERVQEMWNSKRKEALRLRTEETEARQQLTNLTSKGESGLEPLKLIEHTLSYVKNYASKFIDYFAQGHGNETTDSSNNSNNRSNGSKSSEANKDDGEAARPNTVGGMATLMRSLGYDQPEFEQGVIAKLEMLHAKMSGLIATLPDTINQLSEQRRNIFSPPSSIQPTASASSNENSTSGDEDIKMDNAYMIHAVLMHRGQTGHGHYWVYIRDHVNDRWIEYNDENVRVVPKEVVFQHRDANSAMSATPYFLVYARLSELNELATSIPL